MESQPSLIRDYGRSLAGLPERLQAPSVDPEIFDFFALCCTTGFERPGASGRLRHSFLAPLVPRRIFAASSLTGPSNFLRTTSCVLAKVFVCYHGVASPLSPFESARLSAARFVNCLTSAFLIEQSLHHRQSFQNQRTNLNSLMARPVETQT